MYTEVSIDFSVWQTVEAFYSYDAMEDERLTLLFILSLPFFCIWQKKWKAFFPLSYSPASVQLLLVSRSTDLFGRRRRQRRRRRRSPPPSQPSVGQREPNQEEEIGANFGLSIVVLLKDGACWVGDDDDDEQERPARRGILLYTSAPRIDIQVSTTCHWAERNYYGPIRHAAVGALPRFYGFK